MYINKYINSSYSQHFKRNRRSTYCKMTLIKLNWHKKENVSSPNQTCFKSTFNTLSICVNNTQQLEMYLTNVLYLIGCVYSLIVIIIVLFLKSCFYFSFHYLIVQQYLQILTRRMAYAIRTFSINTSRLLLSVWQCTSHDKCLVIQTCI